VLDAAEPLGDRFDGGVDRGLVGDVAAPGVGRGSFGLELRAVAGGLELAGVEVDEGDRGAEAARAVEVAGGGQADVAGAAGDGDDAAGERGRGGGSGSSAARTS
jgi:hypothetical protein